MSSLADIFSRTRDPLHPLAWRGERSVSWQEFRDRVAGLCAVLTRRPEKNWLLALASPLDFAIALFALWHAGKRVVLPPSLRPGSLDSIMGRVDAILDRCDEIIPADTPLTALNPHHSYIDLYTSGSTGEPRRIAKTLAQLDAEVAVLEQLWGNDKGAVLATVPHHHIYGLLFRLLRPLAGMRPFDDETCAAPEILLARLQRLGPATVISSPAQLARMHELIPLHDLKGMITRIISSGGPLPADAAARFRDALGEAPLEILGSTETGGIAWRIQAGDAAWTAFPGVDIRIAEMGAFSITSPFLPDPAPVSTGDAGELLPDGRFILHGRLDRIIKIEEKRLSLADMETRLRGHAWVADAVITVVEGSRRRVAAVAVLTEEGRKHLNELGRHQFAQRLRAHLGHWFDSVLLPRLWRYQTALPYNERGKLSAAALARLFTPEVADHD